MKSSASEPGLISAQHSNLTKTQRNGPRGDVLGTASPVFGKKISGDGGKNEQPDQEKVKYVLIV